MSASSKGAAGPWMLWITVALLLAKASVSGAATNPVIEWNALMLDAIRADNTGPTLSSRNLAILALAMYDAVNSVDGSCLPYLITNSPPPGVQQEIAASAAARLVSITLYPGLRARAEDLFSTLLSGIPPEKGTNSVNWGEQVATAHLDSRSSDGSQTEEPYIPSEAPGQWRRTPPFFRPPLTPHWRHVKPFAIRSAEDFRSPPPPALDSPIYARDYAETRRIGALNSSIRTGEQTEIAVFWSDFSYTAMPPGHWNEIAISIASERKLSLHASARMMALLGLAQADAAIACWETKFHYNTWRPVTAIRRGDEDGNSATDPDPLWDSLLNAPPFPEYTSGHSTFSGASAAVLGAFLGTDTIGFTARSDSLPGVFRTFSSLQACADEIGMSRVYGGIHFMFANKEGKRIGRLIGHQVVGRYLLPRSSLPILYAAGERNGGFEAWAIFEPGTRAILQHSTNLETWSDAGLIDGVRGGYQLQNAIGSASPEFFRLRRP